MRSKQRNQIAICPLNTIANVDCHEWAANQKRQTVMRHFALAATGNIFGLRQINTSSGNLLSVEGKHD